MRHLKSICLITATLLPATAAAQSPKAKVQAKTATPAATAKKLPNGTAIRTARP